MRAIEISKFGSADVLELVDLPEPEPGPGQVAIAVSHAGVNFADVMTRRGDYHRAGGPPLVPGLEVAGTIQAVGDGVDDLHEGQAVAAFTGSGGYAEVALASAGLTYRLRDDGLAPEVAASLPTIAPTALFLVDEVARLRSGDTVLVHAAAGGVGTVLGQIAKARGASLVLGTVGSADKVAYAASFGYDDVIVREGFPAAVDEATGGRGVDVVFDSIGGQTRADSLDVLAPLGRLIAFGNASAEPEVAPEGSTLRSSNLGVIGFSMGSLTGTEPHRVREVAGRVLDMVADGSVRIDVTGVFALGDAASAHQELESGRSRGKLVLEVGEG